jgi:uncharacterized membrane protein YphA (DoxX/SURF4 family)
MIYKRKQKEPFWIKILRVLLAGIFLFSGFTKAIDPIAFSITIEDMFTSFQLAFLHPLALYIAVFMIIAEFTLGFMLLCKIFVKLTAVGYLLFMSFFFLLTMWLFIAEYLEIHYGYHFGVVKDCGCFGKAIKMSNLHTFIKNVFIMIPTVIIFVKRENIPDIRLTAFGKCLLTLIFAALVGLLQLYCYEHLPILDFSDWKKGENIKEIFIGEPAEKDMLFVYQSKLDNSIVHLSTEELMTITDEIPAFYEDYNYVDRIDTILKEAKHPKIEGFSMIDSSAKDYSFALITSDESQYLFLLFMHDLDEVNPEGITSKNLQNLIKKCEEIGMPFAGITNSTQEEINLFVKEYQITFPIYHQTIDPVKGPFMVRDAIRSNPGLILLKGGIVARKWAWRDFPDIEEVEF